ncbi:MAG: peptidase S58 family protein [Acidimicrobiales bacterium]|nr:P1 family peptidase [Hyphomonadaceae bacterium]RZV42026.1 MAG: peptidase S58 family protein [Acidimicrobiales bacterium]
MSKIQTGRQNLLTDVAGLKIGQAHDERVRTGVTVLLPDEPMKCAVDVRGGGPGTRETDALGDSGLIDRVHAIVLSGGSVYGLDAASSVTAELGARGIGFSAAPPPVPVSPIVPAAILFDNANGGNKDWGIEPPFTELGREALNSSKQSFALGNAGAGFGATAGVYNGGLGSASEKVGNYTVGALIAANPIGSPYMPDTNCFWAWPFEVDGEYGGKRPPENFRFKPPTDSKLAFMKSPGASTMIGFVATDADLDLRALNRLAAMAHDGMALAVQPSHTPLDGDTLFAVSTGAKPLKEPAPVNLAELGAAAARCVARSIARGIYEASK